MLEASAQYIAFKYTAIVCLLAVTSPMSSFQLRDGVVSSLAASVRASPGCAQVPGNIRRAEHFCAFLKRFIEYLKQRMTVQAVVQESPTTFMTQLQERMDIDGAPVVLLSCRPLLARLNKTMCINCCHPALSGGCGVGFYISLPVSLKVCILDCLGRTGCLLGSCCHQAWVD